METPSALSRRRPERKRRPSTITLPERAGPHVRLAFSEMKRQGHRYDDVEDGSGVLRSTMKAWRSKNYPNLDSLEAVFGFLGWRFVPIPADRVLPPDIVAELRPLADRLGMSMPLAIESLVAIAAGIHSRFPAEVSPPLAAETVLAEARFTDRRAAA